MTQATSSGTWRIGVAAMALLLPAWGAEAPPRISNLQVQASTEAPPKVEVHGTAALPDNAIINVSLKRGCSDISDIHSKHEKLVDTKRVAVKEGAFETVFTSPLPFGPYRVEVDCDRGRQYPAVKIPAEGGALHAESSFKVDFNDDIAAPALMLADLLKAYDDLNTELEQTHKANPGKADAAKLDQFSRFRTSWTDRLGKLSSKLPRGQEDLLYPNTHARTDALSSKLSLFCDFYASELKGEKNRTHEDHPNWFEPAVAADLVYARRILAEEFAFNAGKKVVDFGYDKASDLLKDVKAGKRGADRQWKEFRMRFGKDLDRCKTGADALSNGPVKEEIVALAPDVPALVAAGQSLLEAVDTEIAAPGKGTAAMDQAKDALKASYLAIRAKIEGANKPAKTE